MFLEIMQGCILNKFVTNTISRGRMVMELFHLFGFFI